MLDLDLFEVLLSVAFSTSHPMLDLDLANKTLDHCLFSHVKEGRKGNLLKWITFQKKTLQVVFSNYVRKKYIYAEIRPFSQYNCMKGKIFLNQIRLERVGDSNREENRKRKQKKSKNFVVVLMIGKKMALISASLFYWYNIVLWYIIFKEY